MHIEIANIDGINALGVNRRVWRRADGNLGKGNIACGQHHCNKKHYDCALHNSSSSKVVVNLKRFTGE